MNSAEIAAMTGEKIYGKKLSVSEITFNGDAGSFFYRHKDAKKDPETDKYPKEDLGKELDVVFMKIRRKLGVFKKKGGLSTNEHNSKSDIVVLYGVTPTQQGTAAEIRERFTELRTQQMVYSYFPAKKEVVRLVIKGSSLGSEQTGKGVLKFYDYLQTFGGDDHMHEFFTHLAPTPEEGPKGTYFALSFSRGAKLSEEQQEKVNAQIVEVHTILTEQDAAFKERLSKNPQEVVSAGSDDDDDDDMPTIHADPLASEFETESPKVEYPDDEINPEDIPF